MIVRDQYGAVCEITPVGYQFGSDASHREDLNWVNIQVRVWTAEDVWGGVDPCLLTGELRELCSWLRLCATGEVGTAEPMLDFMEPELSFEFVAGEPALLRVTTRHGLNTGATIPSADRTVNVTLSRAALLSAAIELEAEAAKFPER